MLERFWFGTEPRDRRASSGPVDPSVVRSARSTERWPPGEIESVLRPIIPAVEAARAQPTADLVHASVPENIRRQVDHLRTSAPLLADLVQSGELKVVGAEYNLSTGKADLVT